MKAQIKIIKSSTETIIDAAKRSINQATLNNREVSLKDGEYIITVKPYDILKDVIMSLKKIALKQEIAALEAQLVTA